MSLIDTRQFYPVVQHAYDCCSIIEDFGGPQSVFHQNAAWQAVYDLGLYRHLQGFYGRSCQDLLNCGLISGIAPEDRLHRQTICIEWDTDDEKVEGLPVHMPALYRGDDEDLGDYNDRLCDWLSDTTGWCVMDFQYVPQAVAGNDNEYHLQNVKLDEITGYVDLEEGVLLVSGRYAFGFGSAPLYVWVDSEDNRQYVCIDDTIVYLDDIGKLEVVL